MATGRVLERTTGIIDGRPVKGYALECSSCGKTEAIRVNNFTGTMNSSKLQDIARNRGWELGNTRRKDTCPTCLAEASNAARLERAQKKAARNANKEAEDMKDTLADRQMSRADRNIIHLRMKEVYPIEEKGYVDHWNDALVAADLGIPEEWVAEVRDINFGPASVKVEVALDPNAVARLDQAEADFRTIETDIIQTMDMIKAMTEEGAAAMRKLTTAQNLMDRTREEILSVARKAEECTAHVNRLRQRQTEGLNSISALRNEIDVITGTK